MVELMSIMESVEELFASEEPWPTGKSLTYLGLGLTALTQLASKMVCTQTDPNDATRKCGEAIDILVNKNGATFHCPKCKHSLKLV